MTNIQIQNVLFRAYPKTSFGVIPNLFRNLLTMASTPMRS